ncbi:restriction endonuclease [Xanthobacter sp. V0B-10]|uniref:restriction endonuclease n=1 Tax=Xanthobacter albus TaxID=3119929 RepID=UPI00372A75A1
MVRAAFFWGGMMGRRRKGSSAEGFVVLFVIFMVGSVLGGAMDFAKRLWGRLQDITGGGEAGAGLIVAGGVGAFLLVIWMMRKAKKNEEHRTIEAAILKACDQNRDAILARNKVKLTAPDEYGLVNPTKWNKELDKFITNFVNPTIPHLATKPKYAPHIRGIIEQRCDDITANGALRHTEATVRNGLEYEVFVGDLLKDQGWDVSLTPASGDQGADVIARRGPEVVVIQCKFYAGAVGNKAVQEVAAARVHYGATQAAVVSKSGFTASARQLAATNDVALLHHDELSSL